MRLRHCPSGDKRGMRRPSICRFPPDRPRTFPPIASRRAHDPCSPLLTATIPVGFIASLHHFTHPKRLALHCIALHCICNELQCNDAGCNEEKLVGSRGILVYFAPRDIHTNPPRPPTGTPETAIAFRPLPARLALTTDFVATTGASLNFNKGATHQFLRRAGLRKRPEANPTRGNGEWLR
jgi:hypothetical protein